MCSLVGVLIKKIQEREPFFVPFQPENLSFRPYSLLWGGREFSLLYSHHSVFGQYTIISSAEGTHLGDPLGSLLFALAQFMALRAAQWLTHLVYFPYFLWYSYHWSSQWHPPNSVHLDLGARHPWPLDSAPQEPWMVFLWAPTPSPSPGWIFLLVFFLPMRRYWCLGFPRGKWAIL